MITLFWIFLIVGVALVGMVILPRNRSYTWAWNIVLVLGVAYFGLYKLTGTPRSTCMLSSLSGLTGDYQIVYHDEVANKAIYLLLQVGDTPIFVETAWTFGRALALQRAAMNAAKEGAVLMVRAEVLSQCGDVDRQDGGDPVDADQNDAPHNVLLGRQNGINAPKHGTEGGEGAFWLKPVEGDPFKTRHPPDTLEVH